MMVLHFSHDTTEEEVDRHFLRAAIDLGITVPQDPKTTLDLVTKNVAALDLSSSAPSEHHTPPSRTSNSTHPTSCSSSEQHRDTQTSSLTSASMISPPSSINSALSHKPSYTKIRKGIRKFSALRRRKTIDAPSPPLPFPIAAIKTLRPAPPLRPATADQFPTTSTTREPVSRPAPETSHPPRVHVPTGSHFHRCDDPAARLRSLQHPRLKQLRWAQLEEQTRFIRFEADQRRVMHSRQAERERRVLAEYPRKVQATKDRHAESLSSVEHRHFSAEVDLERALEVERQACDTRLKHMQAYCNPRSVVKGMPNRVVTKQHYQQLEQQYHERSVIDNLHASRINVLREKQGKQLERIMGKQEAEVQEMELQLAHKMQQLQISLRTDEQILEHEFSERRKRLTSRWSLAEAIERKKIEKESGDSYAPLPIIAWDDPRAGREESEEPVDDQLARDARLAYDASALNMF
ncbi:MAG: hypothetical protein LQ348_006960 [Seirophora lacunosa]|nr:MAG: hypothetical protein LQ348_006960 [Seirophora lacunosa]